MKVAKYQKLFFTEPKQVIYRADNEWKTWRSIFGLEIVPGQRLVFYKQGHDPWFNIPLSRVESLFYYDLTIDYESTKGLPHNINLFADYEYNDIWNYLNENI